MTTHQDKAREIVKRYDADYLGYDKLIEMIALELLSAEQRGIERAAEVAETLGVYPELNVLAGGPEWYRHGKEIAKAIRSLASKDNGKDVG